MMLIFVFASEGRKVIILFCDGTGGQVAQSLHRGGLQKHRQTQAHPQRRIRSHPPKNRTQNRAPRLTDTHLAHRHQYHQPRVRIGRAQHLQKSQQSQTSSQAGSSRRQTRLPAKRFSQESLPRAFQGER